MVLSVDLVTVIKLEMDEQGIFGLQILLHLSFFTIPWVKYLEIKLLIEGLLNQNVNECYLWDVESESKFSWTILMEPLPFGFGSLFLLDLHDAFSIPI